MARKRSPLDSSDVEQSLWVKTWKQLAGIFAISDVLCMLLCVCSVAKVWRICSMDLPIPRIARTVLGQLPGMSASSR